MMVWEAPQGRHTHSGEEYIGADFQTKRIVEFILKKNLKKIKIDLKLENLSFWTGEKLVEWDIFQNFEYGFVHYFETIIFTVSHTFKLSNYAAVYKWWGHISIIFITHNIKA